ncbi:MAG: hypothetical protein ABEJ30_01910 [Halorientalis sp.]
MFDAPADTWYLWLGVAAASVAAFGVAAGLPTAAPADARRAAATVDAVAASPHEATASHPLRADAVRLGTSRVALRTDGGVTHATFTEGPVTPVRDGGPLAAVLRGTAPAGAFPDPAALRRALEAARNRGGEWQETDGQLRVRRITWEGVNATIVGA